MAKNQARIRRPMLSPLAVDEPSVQPPVRGPPGEKIGTLALVGILTLALILLILTRIGIRP